MRYVHITATRGHWLSLLAGSLAIGLAASALAGFAAIWGLLRYLQRASTMVFIVYRIGLGIALLVLVAMR